MIDWSRFFLTLLIITTPYMKSNVLAQSPVPPAGIVVDKNGVQLHKQNNMINNSPLATLEVGDMISIFPECCTGDYFVGFKLFFEDEFTTTSAWNVNVRFRLFHGDIEIWESTLHLDMATQQIQEIVFHDEDLSSKAGEDWKIRIEEINGTVDAPLNLISIGFDYFHSSDVVLSKSLQLNLGFINQELTWEMPVLEPEDFFIPEGFEVEWVHYESTEQLPGTNIQAFTNRQPTRIITTKNFSKIDGIYPDGKLYFRVRVRGMNPSYPDHVILSDWSYGGVYDILNLNDQTTWQRVSSFAEGGKRKHVISFHDGLMKQKQVLTNLSQADVTMVAESKYDFEGRKVLDFLPVPLETDGFNYLTRNNFGTTANSTHYKKAYDKKRNTTTNDPLADSRAADYYNLSSTPGTPMAGDYPYTQVTYSNDQSGRVKKQSGVGDAFHIDSDHTINYFYGSTSKEELERLFGTNFGEASHYRKNLVQDANGQVSVTYLDAEGRTVATALAGDMDSKLEMLPEEELDSRGNLMVDISEHYNWVDGSKVTQYKFMNVNPSTQINYSTSIQAFAASVKLKSVDPDLCASCDFDVEVQITDPHGNITQAISTTISSGEDCGDQMSLVDYLDFNSEIFSEVGEYTITKIITPHEVTYTEARSEVLALSRVKSKLTYIENTYQEDARFCNVLRYENGMPITEAVIPEIVSLGCENIKQLIIADEMEDQPDDPDYTYDKLYALFDDLSTVSSNHPIRKNPRFCEYEYCIDNQSSEIFDRKLFLIDSWSSASHEQKDPNKLLERDPFFAEGNFGTDYKNLMQQHINDKQFIDDDGELVYSGSIAEITDPDNDDMEIEGTSIHFLYQDFMNNPPSTGYSTELNKQRWTLYRSFYLDEKRKIQIDVADDLSCTELKKKLSEVDQVPLTEDGIRNWEDSEYGTTAEVLGPITPQELNIMVASLEMGCGSIFNTSEKNDIKSELESYFALKGIEVLRFIIADDLDPVEKWGYFDDTERILRENGCELTEMSIVMDLQCVRERQKNTIEVTLENSTSEDHPFNPLDPRGDDRCSGFDGNDYTTLTGPIQIAQEDRDFLTVFYTELGGRKPADEGGWTFKNSTMKWFVPGPLVGLKNDYCDMEGVYSDARNGRLDAISVFGKGVSGSIPMLPFAKLRALNFQKNNLEGSPNGLVPVISDLQLLNISHNRFDRFDRVKIVSISTTAWLANIPHLYLNDNYFTFEDLIPLGKIRNEKRYGQLGGQKKVGREISIDVYEGDNIKLTTNIDRNLASLLGNGAVDSKYKWFYRPDGKSAIALNPSFDKNNHTVTINNVNESGSIFYYIKNSSKGVDHLQMESNEIHVNVVPVSSNATGLINNCIEYTVDRSEYSLTKLITNYKTQCEEDYEDEKEIRIAELKEEYLVGQINNYVEDMTASCREQFVDNFSLTYEPKEYHYTLYYYDRAGNLVQTVPPAGVKFGSKGVHGMRTTYQYNSLNQLVSQNSPDGGETHFRYNDAGQLRLSQNAQQLVDKTYSYTKYDRQGRITEVGLFGTDEDLFAAKAHPKDADLWDNPDFPDPLLYDLTEMTRTYYDRISYPDGSESGYPTNDLIPDNPMALPGTYLRGRVAFTEVWTDEATMPSATYYDYDAHGNVKSLVQFIDGLGEKRTDYVYDLISGNVKYVMYQRDQPDGFMHRYHYDDDNRITEVYTSIDGVVWDRDARYNYYDHGPLKNVELGHAQIQHIDYYYTLQGWLKGINIPYAGDPFVGTSTFAKDEFAMTLGYYQEDFESNAPMVDVEVRDQLWTRFSELYNNNGLYNGNIAWMNTDLNHVGEDANDPTKSMQATAYRYDQLNRIIASKAHTEYSEATGFAQKGETDHFDTEYSYDGNGNLQQLTRKDENGYVIDNLDYEYASDNNRMTEVANINAEVKHYTSGPVLPNDGVYKYVHASNSAYAKANETVEIQATEEIVFEDGFTSESNADFTATIADGSPSSNLPVGTYSYDDIGNLTGNEVNGTTIDWTVYGKVKKVTHESGDEIDYLYDAAGNRVAKLFTTGGETTATHYVRDASGNVMAVYRTAPGGGEAEQAEVPIYGSSRLGQYLGGTATATRQLGHKHYELTNHLGNVMAVVGDDLYVTEEGEKQAVVHTTSDYYPFGLEMPGRSLSLNGAYRYGFNGKEKDQSGEWGDQTHYDYGFRIYNPSIGRFLSVDPLTGSYPWYTPYQFSGNSPIRFIDLDGLEEADPQQIKAAEQYYYKTKLSQSEVFPNITPKQINNQVHRRIKNLGSSINQGKFFLCGPAAACHVGASHDPKAYVQTIFDLYLNGFANGKAVKGNDAIYNAKPDGNGNIDGIAAVDWILLHSLRYSENTIDWGGYDPHSKDDVNKMTLKSEFSDLVGRLGANVSFPSSNESISSSDDLTALSDWVDGGKRAVLFINSRAYRGQDSGDGLDGWVSRNYGRHFVVLKGISQTKSGGINVNYWDYGNSGLKTKSFGSFKEFQNSTFNYWLINNDGQKKE